MKCSYVRNRHYAYWWGSKGESFSLYIQDSYFWICRDTSYRRRLSTSTRAYNKDVRLPKFRCFRITHRVKFLLSCDIRKVVRLGFQYQGEFLKFGDAWGFHRRIYQFLLRLCL